MSTLKRHTGIGFENYVAKFYFNKINSCQQDGKEFSLTLLEVRRMLCTKYCQYSGVELTHQYVGSQNTRFTDVTIDRIDNARGYVKGNVKAVCHGFNQLKSTYENPSCAANIKALHKFSNNIFKLTKGKGKKPNES